METARDMSDGTGLQFVISSLTDSEEDGGFATDLLREVFGNAYFDAEYWKWKYSRNPFGPSILIGARPADERAGRVAGFRAFWGWRFRHHGGAMKAAQPCDTVVTPRYRRRGLFGEMTRRALEIARVDRIEVLFNNPNRESCSGYLKLGWRSSDGLQWYAKPLRPARVFGELLRWRGRNPEVSWSRPSGVWNGELDEGTLESLVEDCEERHKEMLWTERSRNFYRWRYGSASHRTYNAIFLQKGGARSAFLIYGTGDRGNLRETQILDLIAGESCKDSVREMIHQLAEVERPDWITFAATGAFPFLKELRKAGFHPLPRTATLLVRSVPASGDHVNEKAFSLTLGDLDTF